MAFIITINGVERQSYSIAEDSGALPGESLPEDALPGGESSTGGGGVRVGAPAGPGIRINREINSIGTADFTVFDSTGEYRPDLGDEVLVYQDAMLLFRGLIDRTLERTFQGTLAIDIDVHCVDYGVIASRRVIGEFYSGVTGGSIGAIAQDIVTRKLADLGITYVDNPIGLTSLIQVLFPYIPVNEALNQLGGVANADWVINADRQLFFFNKSDGYESAPADITDAAENYIGLTVSRTRVKIANRVYAKTSRTLDTFQVDTFHGEPLGIYNTTYAVTDTPTITVNGVDQLVVEIGLIGSDPYEFYYIDNSTGVFYKDSLPSLSPSDTVVVKYPSPLPFVAVAEDAASIAAIGVMEATVEAGDVDSAVALQQIADGALARGIETVDQVEVSTREPGYAPGQRLTIATERPAVSETFIIESVSSRLIANLFMIHTIRASNRQFQRASSVSQYMRELISRTRTQVQALEAGTTEVASTEVWDQIEGAITY